MGERSVAGDPPLTEHRYWNGPTGWLIGDALEEDDIVVDKEGVDWPENDELLRERLSAGSRASYQVHLIQLSEAVDASIDDHPDVLQRIQEGDLDAADIIVAEVLRTMRGAAEVGRVRELVLSLSLRPRTS